MASLPKNHQATQKPYKYKAILGLIVRAENLVMNLVIVWGVHFGIRFFIRHIVLPLWQVGGFSETSPGIGSKFSKHLEINFVDGIQLEIFSNLTIYPVITG